MNKQIAAAFDDELEKLGISTEKIFGAVTKRVMRYLPSAKYFKPGEKAVLPALMEGEHHLLADAMTRPDVKNIVRGIQELMPKHRPKDFVSRLGKLESMPGVGKMMESTNAIMNRLNPKQLDAYVKNKGTQAAIIGKANARRQLSVMTPEERKQMLGELKKTRREFKPYRDQKIQELTDKYPKGMRWKDLQKETAESAHEFLSGLVEPEDPADWWKKQGDACPKIAAAFFDELQKLGKNISTHEVTDMEELNRYRDIRHHWANKKPMSRATAMLGGGIPGAILGALGGAAASTEVANKGGKAALIALGIASIGLTGAGIGNRVRKDQLEEIAEAKKEVRSKSFNKDTRKMFTQPLHSVLKSHQEEKDRLENEIDDLRSELEEHKAAAFFDELEKLSMQPYAPKRELVPSVVPGGAIQTSSEEQKPKKKSNLIALFADDAMMMLRKVIPGKVPEAI